MPLRLFSGEGPNHCSCGHDLPGANHFADDLMPWTRCPGCGLFYVLEDGEVAMYAPSDLVVTPVSLRIVAFSSSAAYPVALGGPGEIVRALV